MKSLNEVIKALECCCEIGKCRTECPYLDGCDNDEEKKDALYYLRRYRDIEIEDSFKKDMEYEEFLDESQKRGYQGIYS